MTVTLLLMSVSYAAYRARSAWLMALSFAGLWLVAFVLIPLGVV